MKESPHRRKSERNATRRMEGIKERRVEQKLSAVTNENRKLNDVPRAFSQPSRGHWIPPPLMLVLVLMLMPLHRVLTTPRLHFRDAFQIASCFRAFICRRFIKIYDGTTLSTVLFGSKYVFIPIGAILNMWYRLLYILFTITYFRLLIFGHSYLITSYKVTSQKIVLYFQLHAWMNTIFCWSIISNKK